VYHGISGVAGESGMPLALRPIDGDTPTLMLSSACPADAKMLPASRDLRWYGERLAAVDRGSAGSIVCGKQTLKLHDASPLQTGICPTSSRDRLRGRRRIRNEGVDRVLLAAVYGLRMNGGMKLT